MAKNDRQQAKRMAEKGKTAEQIQAKTGVGSSHVNRYVERHAPTPAPAPAARPAQAPAPNDRGPAGNTASPTNPGISASPTTPTRSNPSRTTPEIKGLGQGLRVAGENGLGKRDYKTIAETTGKSDDKIIGKLDKINTKLETKGKAGIDLKSGAGNMLIKNAQKNRNQYRGFSPSKSAFGEGAIGSTLQSMLSTPERSGTWIKGHLTGAKEADPGFNPGGHPTKNRLVGGTVIRANGNISNKGVGEQYELPKRFTEGKKDKDKDETIVDNDLDTDLDTDLDGGDGGDGGDGDTPIAPEPTDPVEEIDNSASSGAGGLDLASWATGFKKARSARQKSGSPAQGLASQKKNPFKSWA